MVSIIIPVYNSEKYLCECLDSILHQTYDDLEVICVNDGSNDGSLGLLNRYAEKDARVHVFTKTNEGKGAAAARNLGFGKATGDYVMFLDSDDFFEPDMVSSMMEKAAEAELVICSADRYDDRKSSFVGKYPHIKLEEAPSSGCFSYKDCPDRIFQIGDVLVWNKLFKRSLLLENNLYFEEIPISDDQMVPALSFVFAKKISVVNKQLVHYRINTGSSQVDSQNRYPKSAYEATFTIVERMKQAGLYEEVKQSYLNHAIMLMREYFDKMTDYSNVKFLYDTYRKEVFPRLGADHLDKEYFYDERLGDWYIMIMSLPLEEIIFRSARAHGSPWNTAILRFRFPYEKVQRNSCIVLVGKGLVGRYWYSQLLLSEYCQMVLWVDKEEEIPDDLVYDEIVKTM